ncbi:MAG: CDP-alcohol phosphatidyltransferase family protein [Candidatus Aminicenantes bacterium]|nr:CDP-alcohol phosphatidyltransferase family protein [Candidatus Aminicenantes bacterium]
MSDGRDRERTEALKSAVFTIPNLLSAFRILLVPIFLWSILNGRSWEAVLIFFLAGLTDLLDGFTARVWHQRSKLGTILDPAGDKLLMAASYVVLTLPQVAGPNHIPLWLTVIVFARDLLIVAGAFIAFLSWHQGAFPPSFLGKITTACQVGTVFLVLWLNYRQAVPGFMSWIYVITLLTTIASGVHYFVFGLSVLRQHRKK